MYLLTELGRVGWENIWPEVMVCRPSAAKLCLCAMHFIVFFYFYFSGNKIHYSPKSWDLYSNKIVSVHISQRAICDPSRARWLFLALLGPSRTALIQGFFQ